MSGTNYLLDTNIVLYLMGGDEVLAGIPDTRRPLVSYITEMELLGSPNPETEEEKQIQSFLGACLIVEMNPKIKQSAIFIRRTTGLKLTR